MITIAIAEDHQSLIDGIELLIKAEEDISLVGSANNGEELLKIDHIRRFRFATKGPAIMPMKITSDLDWTNAIAIISDKARKQRKEVCIHTHFNHPRELTGFTEEAMGILFERGIKVRNQSVFQRGVNDDAETSLRRK